MIEFIILEIPNKCTLNNEKSTEILLWKSRQIKVGYNVQPRPIPFKLTNWLIVIVRWNGFGFGGVDW